MDVVARLKSIAVLKTGEALPEWAMGANGWGDALSKMCTDAIAEIEHLRSLAGAVSQGPSFDDVRASIAALKVDSSWADVDRKIKALKEQPALRAFDGA